MPRSATNGPPTDVGFDPQSNIFISDSYCNNRAVKYNRNGRFVAMQSISVGPSTSARASG